MAKPAKRNLVLTLLLVAKLTVLLAAIVFIAVNSSEFFAISSTGNLLERILLAPSLVFILRASVVVFIAGAFGFVIMILFKDVTGLKLGGVEIRFSEKALEEALAKIKELEQTNQELSAEVEKLRSENDKLLVLLEHRLKKERR